MPSVPLNYNPSLPNALFAAFVQFVMLAIVGAALFAFARQRHQPRHVLVMLLVGCVLGWLGGLVYQIVPLALAAPSANAAWRQFIDWQLLASFEMYWCVLPAFAGVIASWVSLEIVGPRLVGRPTV